MKNGADDRLKAMKRGIPVSKVEANAVAIESKSNAEDAFQCGPIP